jgi:hypothetical protein
MDERADAQRLDQIAGLVFEGSIALTAGAAAIAFTQTAAIRTAAFLVAAFCVVPGFAAGWLVLWDPLRHRDEERRDRALDRKRVCVTGAMAVLLVGVPLAGLLIAGVLFFRETVPEVLAAAGVAIGSLLPAALYLSFFRRRLPTLREVVLRSAAGRPPFPSERKPRRGSRAADVSRLLAITSACALGWTIVLLSGDDRGWPGAGSPAETAFLGAYFLTVQQALGRYVTGSFRPKLFDRTLLRIVVTVSGAWLLDRIVDGSDDVLMAVAFLVAALPLPFDLRLLLRSGRVDPTRIDGLARYHVARLADAGVKTIGELADADPVELALETGAPIARVVDWVDQALLEIQLDGTTLDRSRLRRYGIRTASDLVAVSAAGQGPVEGVADDPPTRARLGRLIAALERDPRVRWILDWFRRGGRA